MIEVVSLLGFSYTGKSTLAAGLVAELALEGISADIIRKDEGRKLIGYEKYGEDDNTGGYSISGFLKRGQIPTQELHAWMNKQIRSSLELGRLVVLEGGTRTRTAQAETLHGIELGEDALRIFMLHLPFSEIMRRARRRRQETGRYDDQLLVAAAKLYGQYRGICSEDALHPGDTDVMVLDASLPVLDLVAITRDYILESRTL